MPPKTRSQGAASPAHELQAAPPRTRARKQPKPVEPKIALSPPASSPTAHPETVLPVVASCAIIKPQTVLFPIPTSPIRKPAKPTNSSGERVSQQQLLRSKSLTSPGLTHSRLLHSSKHLERSIGHKSPSPELADLLCCAYCRRNLLDLNNVPLFAPDIVHATTNYQDASTQTSQDERKESSLTVLPAQTPLKRTREESAGQLEAEPTAKRHQSNLTGSSTQTSTLTSARPSTQASSQTSTQIDSSTSAGRQSKSIPVTPQRKRTTMVSITEAKSRAKAPRSSPVSRSNVNPLQLTSDMTWGQMTRVHTRRTQLAANRAKQMQSSEDEEPRDEQSPQPSQSAPDQAPMTPQTAPQPRASFFGSIRKKFDFVPQLPAFTKLLTNPFLPTRSTPDIQEEVSATTKPEVDAVVPLTPPKNTTQPIPGSIPDFIPISDTQAEADVDMNDNTAASSIRLEADAGNATQSPQKRKRDRGPPNPGRTYSLDYNDPIYHSEGSSDEDGSDEESPAPVAKRQKLDETQTPRSVLKKRPGNGDGTGAGTLPRINKHVTFGDSPVDTPSKIRSRCHEYSGVHFADAPSQSYAGLSSDDETNLSNSPGTKANTEANTSFYYPPPEYPPLSPDQFPVDFTPTSAHPRPGTFCLDFNTYDENDDMIDWDAPIEAIKSNIVVGEPETPTSVEIATSTVGDVATTPALALPPATPRIAHAELPTTADARTGIIIHTDTNADPSSTTKATDARVLTDVTQEQINRVRSTVEQHKSKNPSRLSQVERATSMSPPVEDEYNEFDAGWPKPKSYVEAGVCSQRIFDIVNKNWDPRDSIIGEMVYEQSLKEWTDAHRLEKEQGVPVRIDWGDGEDEEL
jgi:hypothetical protein